MPKQKGKPTRWTLVRIPEVLNQQALRVLEKHPELGYTGPPEFYRDAVREKLQRINSNQTVKEAIPA